MTDLGVCSILAGEVPSTSGPPDSSAPNGGLTDNEIAAMPIPQIKNWLATSGYDADVWTLSQRKPPPKRADWVNLITAKIAY